ncbi:Kelch repeat-containing protein [Nocardia sp. NPDC051570]|uniref:Kelch repeat-containing protein n=1 Tax=Nocardia sp. NPDC051570 TaxID=3364324 RepID=UPI0037BAE425
MSAADELILEVESLVAGGASSELTDANPILAAVEIFDPVAGTWTPTGSMSVPRYFHCATTLYDGSVLVTGGIPYAATLGPVIDAHSLATAERWDPTTGQWHAAAPMPFGRSRHQALGWQSTVVVLGGADEQSLESAFTHTMYFDPATDTWTALAPMSSGRFNFAAVALTTGQLLVASGNGQLEGLVTDSEVLTEVV